MATTPGNDRNPTGEELFRQLHTLLTNWTERGLTEEETAQLEHLLSSSKQARQQYYDYIQDTTFLRTIASTPRGSKGLVLGDSFVVDLIEDLEEERRLREEADEAARLQAMLASPLIDAGHSDKQRAPSRGWRTALLAIAGCLALLLYLTPDAAIDTAHNEIPPSPPEPPPEIATISRFIGAGTLEALNVKGAPAPPSTGTRLTRGAYSLGGGFLELQFDTGPLALVQGPARFELSSKNHLELVQGKAVARVPAVAKGFIISTSSASVIDLGTEFAVAASANGSTEVLVLDGEVALKPKPLSPQSQSPGQPEEESPGAADFEQRLTAGNARMVSPSRVISVLENANRSKFLRSLDGLIAVDNLDPVVGTSLKNGGTGFTQPWIVSNPLVSFTDGEVTFRDGNDAIIRRHFTPVDASRTPVFFSGQFRISGNDPLCSVWLALSQGDIEEQVAVVGLTDQQFAIRLRDRGSDLAKTRGAFGNFQPGQRHFIVGKLEADVAGQMDRLSIWVDPQVDNPGAPDKVLTDDLGYTTINSVSVMFWQFEDKSTGQGAVDNIRIGTSWGAVQ